MTTNTDALLKTVQEAVEICPHMERRRRGLAALDALASELERLREGNADLVNDTDRNWREAREAEAELERVKAERDALFNRRRILNAENQELQRRLDAIAEIGGKDD